MNPFSKTREFGSVSFTVAMFSKQFGRCRSTEPTRWCGFETNERSVWGNRPSPTTLAASQGDGRSALRTRGENPPALLSLPDGIVLAGALDGAFRFASVGHAE
jgi:hypothetical protein